MAAAQVKGYTRRGKNGKTVSVRSHTRKLYMITGGSAGEELKSKQTHKMSTDEILTEEKRLGYDRFQKYGTPADPHRARGYAGGQYAKKVGDNKSTSKEKKGKIASVEDKLANFVDKYSKKKYKRMF